MFTEENSPKRIAKPKPRMLLLPQNSIAIVMPQSLRYTDFIR